MNVGHSTFYVYKIPGVAKVKYPAGYLEIYLEIERINQGLLDAWNTSFRISKLNLIHSECSHDYTS
jgi:hypothetical protein